MRFNIRCFPTGQTVTWYLQNEIIAFNWHAISSHRVRIYVFFGSLTSRLACLCGVAQWHSCGSHCCQAKCFQEFLSAFTPYYWASHYLTFFPKHNSSLHIHASTSLLPFCFLCPSTRWKMLHDKPFCGSLQECYRKKNILIHPQAGLSSVKTAGIKDTSRKVCSDTFQKQRHDPSFWRHVWPQPITSGHFVLSKDVRLWCITALFRLFEETL